MYDKIRIHFFCVYASSNPDGLLGFPVTISEHYTGTPVSGDMSIALSNLEGYTLPYVTFPSLRLSQLRKVTITFQRR